MFVVAALARLGNGFRRDWGIWRRFCDSLTHITDAQGGERLGGGGLRGEMRCDERRTAGLWWPWLSLERLRQRSRGAEDRQKGRERPSRHGARGRESPWIDTVTLDVHVLASLLWPGLLSTTFATPYNQPRRPTTGSCKPDDTSTCLASFLPSCSSSTLFSSSVPIFCPGFD